MIKLEDFLDVVVVKYYADDGMVLGKLMCFKRTNAIFMSVSVLCQSDKYPKLSDVIIALRGNIIGKVFGYYTIKSIDDPNFKISYLGDQSYLCIGDNNNVYDSVKELFDEKGNLRNILDNNIQRIRK